MSFGTPIALGFWVFVGGVGVCGLWEDARLAVAQIRDRIDGRDRRRHIAEMGTPTVSRPQSLIECNRLFSLPTSTEAND